MQPLLSRATRALTVPITIVFSCAVVCLAGTTPSAAGTTIGAYSDYGSSCSFSGNSPGLVTAHIIVRPDQNGVRAVRFTAPPPPCMGATWVADVVPAGIIVIGDSQTGISLSASFCEGVALHVLDIIYQVSGTTASCCPFELQPEPGIGFLEAADCSFNSVAMTSVTSHFNADSTCACHVDYPPPNAPTNPVPQDGASAQNLDLTLTWWCDDPAGLDVVCDLYMGTSADPPLLASDIYGWGPYRFKPARLHENTTYYWRVRAHNRGGGTVFGPVWQFSTGPNYPPLVVLSDPADGAAGITLTPTLKWTGYDDSPLTYDVYFGTSVDPPLVKSGQTAVQYAPGTLPYETVYSWRVVAHDVDGGEGSSPTWSFTTRPLNLPPNVPTATSPVNGATNISVTTSLNWQCTDPDGQALNFDVYFGTAGDPPLVRSKQSSKSYSPGTLQVETTYYWRILARDTGGATRSGPVWSFRTRNNTPPSAPSNPTPGNGSTGNIATTPLLWNCSDPDGQSLAYDVYWGTTSPPPLVASSVSTKSYNPGTQQYLTKYYWRIVARDTKGAETGGPTWAYTTKSANDPPKAPSIPQPANAATTQPVNVKVSWQASDPENDALTFDVYFGTDASPPLVADHISNRSYDPGPLVTSTVYRWKVVARDVLGQETTSPLWSFTTASTANLPPTALSSPHPADGASVTSMRPLLSWSSTDPDGDPLHYTLFMFINDTFPDFYAQTDNPYYQIDFDLFGGRGYTWYVVVSDGYWSVTGPWWTFTVSGGNVPVAFQSFEATQSGAAVRVHWQLASDEPMESYTLYRRDGQAEPPIVLTTGPVDRREDSYLDTSVAPGRTYRYELVVHSADDEFRSPVATVSTAEQELALHQNHPNPFNPQTTIAYDLPAASHVRLSILDVSGRVVRTLVNETQAAGTHSALWNGHDDGGNLVSSGVYFYVLDAGKERLTRKLVLLK